MKNITFSINADLIKKSREYSCQHGTTLKQLIIDLLKEKVMTSPNEKGIERLFELADKHPSQLENDQFCREEIYDL